MANYVGQQLGNYRLLRLLGRGGFAEVYLGEHVRLGMKAAIKVLHTHLAADEVSAFQQEARIIADLKHPHIIRVLDFDVHAGTPFLVLDYASKGSLRMIHPKGSKLSLGLVVTYIEQIANALQYAHEHKLIHRDVKPENVLLGEHGELLLADFGIATIAHSTSSMSTQASMGTLAYMAPEQIQGKPRSASDQYALAVTVYQWLAGVLPFEGSSTELIAQHLGAPPPPLRTQVPDLPAEVEQVVLTALAKDPGLRFHCVQAFATAFALASERASVSPHPFSMQGSQSRELASDPAPQPAPIPAGASSLQLSPTLPIQPALTSSLPSSRRSSVLQQRSKPVAKFRLWIIGIALSCLVLVVIIGSLPWSANTKPGQGDGSAQSPYHLSAQDSSTRRIGVQVKGWVVNADMSTTAASVTCTVDLFWFGQNSEIDLSWQGLHGSDQYKQYHLQEASLDLVSSGQTYEATSKSLNAVTFSLVPQSGQEWKVDLLLWDQNAEKDYEYTFYLQF